MDSQHALNAKTGKWGDASPVKEIIAQISGLVKTLDYSSLTFFWNYCPSQNPYRNPAIQIPYLHLGPQVSQLYWGVRLFQSTKGHVHLSGTVGWIFLSKYNLILDYIKDHLSLGHSLPNVGVFSRCGLFPAYE